MDNFFLFSHPWMVLCFYVLHDFNSKFGCCLCFGSVAVKPIFSIIDDHVQELWIVSDLFLQVPSLCQRCFSTGVSKWGMNFAAVCFKLSYSAWIHWHKPYDWPTLLKMSSVACRRSSCMNWLLFFILTFSWLLLDECDENLCYSQPMFVFIWTLITRLPGLCL